MTGSIYTPGKVSLKRCSLAGFDIRNWVQNIKVYESMCTPYIKSDITVVDNGTAGTGGAGIILGIAEQTDLPGSPVKFSFYGGDEYYDRDEQVVLTVDSHPSEENKRTRVYNIGTIGASYKDDRQNLVQESFVNQPATAAASQIHRRYLPTDNAGLNVLRPSTGPIAMDKIGKYGVRNMKPFAAIEKVLKRATYGGIPCPTVYFRDADNFVMGPLHSVFTDASNRYQFFEYGTLGIRMEDIFGQRGHESIIAASIIIKEKDMATGGRTKMGGQAVLSQMHNIRDIAKKVMSIEKSGGRLGGGMPNVNLFNSLRNQLSQDPSMCRPMSEEFLAKVKDADKYLVKVPIKYGVRCTVGQAVYLEMMGATGTAASPQKIQGSFLCADVMHDCYFDQRTLMGTTVMRCVKISDVV